MRKILLFLAIVLMPFAAEAKVHFGVGLNFIGDTGAGMGFNLGYGWPLNAEDPSGNITSSAEWGIDFAHYGVQPTLYSFGTVSLSQDRLGLFYQPYEWLVLQIGMHGTKLNLSDSIHEVLGATSSSSWSGLYFIVGMPIYFEKTYYLKPYYGLASVDQGKRNEVVFGLELGAEFDTNQKIIF